MKRVLVVDDEPALLRIFKMEFSDHSDMSLCTAKSGSEALKLLIKEPFDIIITDLTMPRMSGIELLSMMKKKNIKIPCTIVLSGLPESLHSEQLKTLGITKYFEKPFSINQIVNYVGSNCPGHH